MPVMLLSFPLASVALISCCVRQMQPGPQVLQHAHVCGKYLALTLNSILFPNRQKDIEKPCRTNYLLPSHHSRTQALTEARSDK